MTSDIDIDPDFAALVRNALQAVAETLPEADDHGPAVVPPGRRRPRARVGSIAAIVVVIAGLVGVALIRDGKTAGPADIVAGTETSDQWLVPAWVPEGMKLLDVGWSGPERWPGDTKQLFGDPDNGRLVLLELAAYDPDDPPPPPAVAETVAVRGREGWAAISVDGQGKNPVDSIIWREHGRQITARYKDIDRAEVLDLLAGLDWRSQDTSDGFAPTGELPLLAAEGLMVRDVRLIYGDDRSSISIQTQNRSGTDPAWVEEWFYRGEEPSPNGNAPVYNNFSQGALDVYWAHGRDMSIRSDNPTIDEDTLRRIADSVSPADEPDLKDLESTALDNVEALPLVSEAPRGELGMLEVRGQGNFHRLCLRRPDGQFDCGFVRPNSEGTTGIGVVNSWLIDGTWYVASAATGTDIQLYGDRAADPADDPLVPDVTTDIGDWTYQFLTPPPDVTYVMYGYDGRKDAGYLLDDRRG